MATLVLDPGWLPYLLKDCSIKKSPGSVKKTISPLFGQVQTTDYRQTDRKLCIWAHRASCTGGLKNKKLTYLWCMLPGVKNWVYSVPLLNLEALTCLFSRKMKPKHHIWLWFFDLNVTLWLHFFSTRPLEKHLKSLLIWCNSVFN